MQKNDKDYTLITADAEMSADTHGGRAKCLQRLVRLNLPVPRTIALSFNGVHRLASGEITGVSALLEPLDDARLLCARPSSEDPDWGGPGAILNIGMNDARFDDLSGKIGKPAAAALYLRFIQAYAIYVARLDPDMFDDISDDPVVAVPQALDAYEAETTSSSHRKPPGNCLRCSAQWRAPGKARPPDCYDRPRARLRMRDWALWCRNLPLVWALENADQV